jgi:hypothetical protein
MQNRPIGNNINEEQEEIKNIISAGAMEALEKDRK